MNDILDSIHKIWAIKPPPQTKRRRKQTNDSLPRSKSGQVRTKHKASTNIFSGEVSTIKQTMVQASDLNQSLENLVDQNMSSQRLLKVRESQLSPEWNKIDGELQKIGKFRKIFKPPSGAKPSEVKSITSNEHLHQELQSIKSSKNGTENKSMRAVNAY